MKETQATEPTRAEKRRDGKDQKLAAAILSGRIRYRPAKPNPQLKYLWEKGLIKDLVI